MTAPLDVEHIRAQFPGLQRQIAGQRAVFLDGPAGSQVPQSVADAISHALLHENANVGGSFATSQATDRSIHDARAAAATFLGADDPECIVFGPNMTALTFRLAQALALTWRAGDEVVVTRLDHDANVTPWVRAAAQAGAQVKWVELDGEGNLDLASLARALSPRTRLVAFTAAGNLIGTLPPVREMVAMAKAHGALTFIDAVHWAAHRRVDVAAWGCDLLACSVYKFFGPHVGILWGKREVLGPLVAEKVRPAKDALPYRFMQGTANHEGIAGARAAIDYLADLGRAVAGQSLARGAALTTAFAAIERHETALCAQLLEGLAELRDLRVYGVPEPQRAHLRAPTVSFTHARKSPQQIAQALGARGIAVWAGHAYAVELAQALGVAEHGVVRVGLLHYNTAAEVERFLGELREALA